MLKSYVKTYKYRIGKNRFLVIKIYQSATARSASGNVLASNAVNVKIFKFKNRKK